MREEIRKIQEHDGAAVIRHGSRYRSTSSWRASCGSPLLLEGQAGVGKTEIAKVLARLLDAELIRLQCYEGLDVTTALYEWNYPKQMLHIRLAEARGDVGRGAGAPHLRSDAFLLRRPLLRAIRRQAGPPCC